MLEASYNGQETVSRVESSDVGVDVVRVPTDKYTFLPYSGTTRPCFRMSRVSL